jgi:arylsulfatase
MNTKEVNKTLWNPKHIFSKIVSTGILLAGACSTDGSNNNKRPNILIILADDMGYSDMGCYGGEIETPNLDRLAENGLRFSHFYNAGRSCPTRASLLTGLYPHQAGIGRMTFDDGLPGYRGTMTHNGVTVAEVLQDAGYQTGMIGKWHVAETPLRPDQRQWLAHQVQYDEFAPIDNYPTRRGFQHFYGTIYGVVDYFDPFSLVNDETPVTDVPEGYYSTIALADSASAYIDRYAKSEKPFFLYLAFHSPHWPLHALPEDIAKYENTYKAGWEAIRNARYERIRQKGIFSDTASLLLSPRQFTDLWSENHDSIWDAHAMAVHAAMVYRMDMEIGKVIRKLETSGELDNTLILFLVDNGCSNESPQFFTSGENDRPAELRDGVPVIYPKKKEALPGAQNVWSGVGAKWANVANTPFRFWKALMYEGGICTPAIACWPAGLKVKKGSVTGEPCHVVDIMATCIDIAGAEYPATRNDRDIIPLEGISFLPVLQTDRYDRRHELIGFEHFREKALVSNDKWKIVQRSGKNVWELYNLNTDRTELHDLSDLYPEKLKEMTGKYAEWAERCYVTPSPDNRKK